MAPSRSWELPHERIRIVVLVLLLTLNAGWVDALAYLLLGHVFASFLSGNFIFIGTSLVQGKSELLIRAVLAVLGSFVGSTLGSLWLQRAQGGRTEPTWRNTHVPLLLMEAVVLLAFAVVWGVSGDVTEHGATEVVLLVLAALAMGIQGALVAAFDLPGVVANALTGTVLTLGRRLARRVEHREVASPEGKWWSLFLAVLPLLYTASAITVALTAASGLPPVVPVLLLTVAIVSLHVPLHEARASAPPSG